jgi:hypothetical protein
MIDRSKPFAWVVEINCATVEFFTDYGLALAYSIKLGGVLSPVFKGQPVEVVREAR